MKRPIKQALAPIAAVTLALAVVPGVALGQGSPPQAGPRARECPRVAALEREVQALRARLSEIEGTGGSMRTEEEASRRSRQLTGTIETLDGEVVWLRDEYGNLLRVVVDEATPGRQGDRAVSARSLSPGMNVRARTEVRDGEQVAQEVEVLPPAERRMGPGR